MKEQTTGPGGVSIVSMPPQFDMRVANQIWVGRPKIGKTSTAAALGTVAKKYDLPVNPFFLLFEPGSGGVNVTGSSMKCSSCKGTGKQGKTKCPDCSGSGVTRKILTDLKDADEWIEWAAKSDFNPIVFDTMDAFFQTVSDGVCQEMGITSPYGANDHGLSWTMIRDRIRESLATLNGAGKGTIMIMHTYTQRKRVKNGEIEIQTFNIPGSTRQYLASLANQILHFDVVPDMDDKDGKDAHVLFAQPQAGIEAGDHWNLFPEMLKLGTSPESAAEAILTVFGFLEDEK